jgi:hypothetical protein
MKFQDRSQPQSKHYFPVDAPLNTDQFGRSTRHFSNHSSARRQIADPGGNLRTAFKIPPFTGQRDFINTVNVNDQDVYRLRLKERRIIKATATNFSDNSLSIAILGRQGVRTFAQDDVVSTGQKSQLTQLELAAGTYYIRLEGSANVRSAYRLKLSIQKISNQNSGGGGSGDGFDDGGFDDGGFNDGGFGGGNGGGFTGDYDCGDFVSQSQAEGYLLPGDPYGLDGDGDGFACEDLPF